MHDTLPAFKIDLTVCAKRTDFGQGFYTTSWEHQACNWANNRVRKSRRARASARAVIPCFAVSRYLMADLQCLCFVRADNTQPLRDAAYDVVFGRVSLGSQRLVVFDSYQVSFHTNAGIAALSAPYVTDIGSLPTGLLT